MCGGPVSTPEFLAVVGEVLVAHDGVGCGDGGGGVLEDDGVGPFLEEAFHGAVVWLCGADAGVFLGDGVEGVELLEHEEGVTVDVAADGEDGDSTVLHAEGVEVWSG